MAKLKYVNSNNKSIELGNTAPFLVLTVDGLGSPQNEIYTQKSPYQDGVSVTGSSLESRNIVLEGKIIDSNRANRQAYRNTLLSVFNPKLSGKLIVDFGNTQRQIDCKVEQAPYFASGSGQNHQDFSVSLIAPDPYWQSVTESETEIVMWIGGLEFPLVFPTQFSTAGEKRINVINAGDVETPIRVEISAPATNPTLTHLGTGEFIRIKRELTGNDVLVITTDFGNKRVEIGGESKFHYIDQETTFFSLLPGDNILEYTSDDEQEKARVRISYKNRFLGV